MTECVRVGIIGLGEVAQVTHLPVLSRLRDRYQITAIGDVSRQLVDAIGDRLHLPTDRRYTDGNQLVARDDIDLVFVLTSDEYHAEQAIAALGQGKHVLIEKPIALNLRDAQAIIDARDAAGRQVIAGYMRRFADAFTLLAQRLPEIGPIRYVRVRDIIGANRLIIEQVEEVLRFDDIAPWLAQERTDRGRDQVRAAVGDVPLELARAYRLLGGLGSHDLSAMRELIGVPDRVVAAEVWQGGGFMNAIFAKDDFRVMFEMGTDQQRRFDAHIAIYGAETAMTVTYDTPYIRHLPTTLTIQRTDGDAYHEERIRPTFTDPYTRELEHVHAVVTGRATPKTTPEDSLHDLRLFQQIIAKAAGA